MRLYIAEKASVGRALSAVLPGDRVKEGDHIRCGEDIVAWASGHLLELYEPDNYEERYKNWNLGDLPIVPKEWKLKEIPRTKSLLSGLRKLLRGADEVINAGDSDREGQLLIDEILEYCGWKGSTKRLRINDVNPEAIRKALKEMKDNADYIGEYRAGQARSYADWLAGMNLTRYCTVNAANAGYEGVFSVGRVQTPTLGLVVQRDREIENFVSKPYYDMLATLILETGNRQLAGRWQPGEGAILDEEGRLVDSSVANALEEKLTEAVGSVVNVERKMRKKTPPLPYSLAQLQIEASKKYDITDTLDHAQKLYEKGYITYPRSGCRHIPEGHHKDAPKIIEAISVGCDLTTLLKQIDVERRSPAWDDSKITEHIAILPTVKVPLEGSLTENERKIYDLICLRYAIQFLPDHEFKETTVEFVAAGERFKATGKEIVVPGWMGWEEDEEEKKEPEARDGGADQGKALPFPTVAVGESGNLIPHIEEKRTTPPKRFTYDSLLTAMNGIHLYVQDKEIRKQLKELDGIGTSATQENTVKLLFERGFIEKKKKQLFSMPTGRALIDLLSAGKGVQMVKPDLTALWEQKMTQIEKGELKLDTFLQEVTNMVGTIVEEPLVVPEIGGVEKKKKCLKEGCDGWLRKKEGKFGVFFSCPTCENTFNSDTQGNPVAKKVPTGEVVEANCPLGCGQKARQFSGEYGKYWRCRCSPDKTFKDEDCKPVVRDTKPTAHCPVKGCKGSVARFAKKDGGGLFWKCETCGNFFDDEGGKPKLREKKTEKKDEKKAKGK